MPNSFIGRMAFNETVANQNFRKIADLLKQESQYMAQKELRSESLFQDVGRKLADLRGIIEDVN